MRGHTQRAIIRPVIIIMFEPLVIAHVTRHLYHVTCVGVEVRNNYYLESTILICLFTITL